MGYISKTIAKQFEYLFESTINLVEITNCTYIWNLQEKAGLNEKDVMGVGISTTIEELKESHEFLGSYKSVFIVWKTEATWGWFLPEALLDFHSEEQAASEVMSDVTCQMIILILHFCSCCCFSC